VLLSILFGWCPVIPEMKQVFMLREFFGTEFITLSKTSSFPAPYVCHCYAKRAKTRHEKEL